MRLNMKTPKNLLRKIFFCGLFLFVWQASAQNSATEKKPEPMTQKRARFECKAEKRNLTRKDLKSCILEKMGMKEQTQAPAPAKQ